MFQPCNAGRAEVKRVSGELWKRGTSTRRYRYPAVQLPDKWKRTTAGDGGVARSPLWVPGRRWLGNQGKRGVHHPRFQADSLLVNFYLDTDETATTSVDCIIALGGELHGPAGESGHLAQFHVFCNLPRPSDDLGAGLPGHGSPRRLQRPGAPESEYLPAAERGAVHHHTGLAARCRIQSLALR
jgi:hypothetical protein